jgi:DNA ligase (NAD+)
MTIDFARERILALRDKINYYNQKYYEESISEISDLEFDRLLEELILLERSFPELQTEDSPSQRVGGAITKEFKTVFHKRPMLSLGNTYTLDEVLDFDERVRKSMLQPPVYFCEQKFDGVAISLIYKNGKLSQAVTRGDGEKGDDITNNAKTIRSLPLTLRAKEFPAEFEVRGEVYLSQEAFDALNREKEEAGEEKMANPRNTASGTLKLQDSAEVARRKLSCYVYQLLVDDQQITNHAEGIALLEKWGFPVSPTYHLCPTIEAVFAYINKWDHERHSLPLVTDGVVIKVNDFRQREMLGFTAKSPRWAIAFKYKSESAKTRLLHISYQVGRTGAVTPVANLQAVLLAGTTVKRASLHNANEIERLQLHEGDMVFVEKGGEIIPKITGVEFESRSADAKPILFPTHCPICGTRLVRSEGEAAFYCPNDEGCAPQIKGRIEHFIQRKAMEIENLGAETIELLFQEGLVKNPADLYDLQYEQVLSLSRFAEKSARNLIDAIDKSKAMPFENVLFALGIRFVGRTVAEKLARHFGSMNALMTADREALLQAPEVGEKIADSLLSYFSLADHLSMIQRLEAHGLQLKIEQKETKLLSSSLEGKTFLISGVFAGISREELSDRIQAHGGKMLSGVSGNLQYLVAGENMGPSKLEKARKLGVQIISEQELNNMIKP